MYRFTRFVVFTDVFYLFLTPTLGRSFQKFIEVDLIKIGDSPWMSFEMLFGFEGLFCFGGENKTVTMFRFCVKTSAALLPLLVSSTCRFEYGSRHV